MFGRKKKQAVVVDVEVELIRFMGALNGEPPDMEANAKLVALALEPVKELFTDAVSRRADTIRVDPKGDRATIGFLIDGIPVPAGRVPRQRAHAMTQMVKVLSGLDIAERTAPQAGGVKASLGEDEYELLVSTTPLEGGVERLTVYVRNLDEVLESPEDIGMSTELKLRIRELTADRQKLFLVCGPHRGGITSTLYACLRGLDAYLHQIYTIGDTEDRRLINITPFEVEEEDDLETTLSRCIRVEAEVILLDPIRSAEVAQTVLDVQDKVAMLTEITAKDAAEGIMQMVEWIGNTAAVAAGLSAVLSQKLIRRLCPECREAYKPNPELLKRVGLDPEETSVLYRKCRPPTEPLPKGEEWEPCTTCDETGYVGRVAIFELIEMSESIVELIAGGADAAALRAQVREEDMLTLQKDSMRWVAEGVTSLEELQRAFKSG